MDKLLASAEDRIPEFLRTLEYLVGIDSGSFSPRGVNAVADACEARFSAAGWEVERRPHRPQGEEPQFGDLLIGRLPGEGARILMIGHMDTVFEDGTASARPFRVADGRAWGPGVIDMKSGLLLGFFAVELLRDRANGVGNLTYVCNPDEEIGSPFSGPVIRELAADADVALVLESAREDGSLVSARNGVTDVEVFLQGRAAHAGVEPERGRSAVLEAAHKTVALHALNGRWPGVTVNVGVLEGGDRSNVVADRARLCVDVRAPKEDLLRAVEEELEQICSTPVVEGVEITVRKRCWHRPMERTEATARLVARAQAVARRLGFDLSEAATGGASDANTTSSLGVPTLDGLGPVGGDAHAASEWLDVSSIAPRLALLAGLLADLSEDAP